MVGHTILLLIFAVARGFNRVLDQALMNRNTAFTEKTLACLPSTTWHGTTLPSAAPAPPPPPPYSPSQTNPNVFLLLTLVDGICGDPNLEKLSSPSDEVKPI